MCAGSQSQCPCQIKLWGPRHARDPARRVCSRAQASHLSAPQCSPHREPAPQTARTTVAQSGWSSRHHKMKPGEPVLRWGRRHRPLHCRRGSHRHLLPGPRGLRPPKDSCREMTASAMPSCAAAGATAPAQNQAQPRCRRPPLPPPAQLRDRAEQAPHREAANEGAASAAARAGSVRQPQSMS